LRLKSGPDVDGGFRGLVPGHAEQRDIEIRSFVEAAFHQRTENDQPPAFPFDNLLRIAKCRNRPLAAPGDAAA